MPLLSSADLAISAVESSYDSSVAADSVQSSPRLYAEVVASSLESVHSVARLPPSKAYVQPAVRERSDSSRVERDHARGKHRSNTGSNEGIKKSSTAPAGWVCYFSFLQHHTYMICP